MTAVMRWKVSVGHIKLPAAYSAFFTIQVQRLLRDDRITNSKIIISVWNSWDRVRIEEGLGIWERNKMAATVIQRNKKRRKKKLEQ